MRAEDTRVHKLHKHVALAVTAASLLPDEVDLVTEQNFLRLHVCHQGLVYVLLCASLTEWYLLSETENSQPLPLATPLP